VKLGDNQELQITISEDDKLLEEVVVVGYGTQKKVNLTGAISTVTAKDINNRPVSNAAMALQGIAPGLNITVNSGTPNGSYNLNIRGISSLSSSSVNSLILIDGVEGSLSRITANDIDSISVLQDASASAIYGAKASAGVILVTTKKGSAGEAKISYAGRYGWASPTTSTDYITTGYWSAFINDKFLNTFTGKGYTNYTDADYAELWARVNDKTEHPDRPWVVPQADGTYKYYANFDWYNYLYKKVHPQQEHNLSISGGNEKVQYYVSGRYYDNRGIFKIQEDYFNSYNLRSKVSVNLKPWLRFTNNTKFFASEYFYPGTSGENSTFRSINHHALAYIPPVNPDGSIVYITSTTNGSYQVTDGLSAVLTYNKHKNTNYDREITTINRFDVDVLKGLTLSAEHAYTFRYREYNNRSVNIPYSQYVDQTEWLKTGSGVDSYNEQHYRTQDQTVNAYATYEKSLDSHNLKLTTGINYEKYHDRDLRIRKLDLLSDELSAFSLATGEINLFTGTLGEFSSLGYFGRVNYDYAGRYLLELSGRYDGSSRFPRKDRFGFFPSASIGWRISEEKFWSPVKDVVSNTKIRLSYGSLGNHQVDNYSYIQSISANKSMNYSFDGKSLATYSTEDAPVSGSLTWEKVYTQNIGLDLGFVNNRLNISGDAYIRDTKGMLMTGKTLPAVYGADEPEENAANMRTRGWEMQIAWNDRFNLLGKPFNYSLAASLSDYTTKVTKWDSQLLTDTYQEGMTLGEIWGYAIDGYFSSDAEAANWHIDQSFVNERINASVGEQGIRAGDLKYRDLNGNNVIDPGDNTRENPGDRYVIGNSLPRYTYGINLGADWNNIDFSILFQGVGKQNWYPGNQSVLFWGPYSRPYATFMPTNFMDNVWSEENPNAYFPRPRAYEALDAKYSLGSANDRYLQDVSYFRCKNLTIGYTLPALKKYIDTLRIYFTGENLFYLSPLTKVTRYVDPEQAVSGSAAHTDSGQVYGFSKTYSIGVNITF
jgi:TonB-linked SusC/RagA family outer membrane protein